MSWSKHGSSHTPSVNGGRFYFPALFCPSLQEDLASCFDLGCRSCQDFRYGVHVDAPREDLENLDLAGRGGCERGVSHLKKADMSRAVSPVALSGRSTKAHLCLSGISEGEKGPGPDLRVDCNYSA